MTESLDEQFVLALLDLPKIGRKSAWKAVQATKATPRSASEMSDALSDLPPKTLPRQPSFNEVSDAWARAASVLENCERQSIKPLACTRTSFPAWLKSIPDAPVMLFIKGNEACLHEPKTVAVIGTREPTDFGEESAFRFGKRGAEAGYVVVSGLAVGCDTAGHRGCLDAGGKTVAVLAHGLHTVYPKQSKRLAEEIVEKGGCLVSEYAPGVSAQRSHFVERDRLQAGLSSGLIVAETDVDGGTMHTVRFAEEQGKPIACIQHPPSFAGIPKTRGNAALIKDERAKPLGTANDLQRFLDLLKTRSLKWETVTEWIDDMVVVTSKATTVVQIKQSEFSFDEEQGNDRSAVRPGPDPSGQQRSEDPPRQS